MTYAPEYYNGGGGGSAPTTPGTLIGQSVTRDKTGAIESGVAITLQAMKTDGGSGMAGELDLWTVTSDDNGLAEFDGVVIGYSYAVWRGDVRYAGLCLVPDEGDESGRFSITSVLGTDGA